MMNFIIRVILLSCIFIKPSQAQVITFERTFGGTASDQGYSVVQCNDGGYVVAGYTGSSGAGGDDAYILKTDEFGNLLWSKTFGGTSDDALFCVEQTNDNGYIFCGSYTNTSFERIMYLIKTDENGDSTWTKKYRLSEYCILQSVQQTTDGGYIIAGYGATQIYLVKTDEFGDTLWTKEFSGPSLEIVGALVQTTDNGYVIVGTTFSYGAGGGDVYLIKTDINGDTLWTKTYGGVSQDYGESIQQCSDGGFIILGWTLNFGDNDGHEDYYLIKTDSNGNELWYKTFESYPFNRGFSVVQTSDGGFALAGWAWNIGGGLDRSMYLVKTNSVGDLVREKLIDSTILSTEYAFDIKETSDKGFIITGSVLSPATGNTNGVLLLKTDSTFSLATTGLEDELIKGRMEVKISPNPFSEYTSVTIQLSEKDYNLKGISMGIYDLLGRRREIIMDRAHPDKGEVEIKLYRGDLSSGVYFYTLTNKSEIFWSGKLIVREW